MRLEISCFAALFLLVGLTSGQQTPLITPTDQSVQVVNTVAVDNPHDLGVDENKDGSRGRVALTQTLPHGPVQVKCTVIANLTIANLNPEPSVFISDFTTDSFVNLTGTQLLLRVRLKKDLRFEKAPSTQALYVVAARNGYTTTATITLYITKPGSVQSDLNITGLIPNPQNLDTVVSNMEILTQRICDVYAKQTPATTGMTRVGLFCLIYGTVYKTLLPTIVPEDPENYDSCNSTMPCLNGGACIVAQNGTKVCSCQDGTYGRRCEYGRPRSSCESNPCRNWATCVDRFGSYSCICPIGYTGTQCHLRSDTSACNATMPCLNGGSCYTAPNGSRSCMCFNGAYGRRCEYVNVDCRSNPCQNGASCITNNGYSKCYCGSGFYGTYCQNRNDTSACNATMPCLNGGSCYTAPNGSRSCMCYNGAYGRRCEYVNVDCRSNPCQNGASCLAVSNTVSKCYCRSGFYGTYCQNRNDTNACNATMPCLNGGTCYTAPNGSKSCLCYASYGRRCEYVNVDCRSNPCQNGASCLAVSNTVSKCYCRSGFYGTYCQNRNDTSACNATMPCLNGGSCYTAPNGSRSCMCFNGAYGRRCEYVNVDCRSNPCQNGASCLTNNGYSKCYCGFGFYGTYCQNRNDTSACNATMPCLNGGSCYTAPNGSRSCMCYNGAYGRRCEYVNVDCRSNPCQNGASCLAVSNTVSKCYCRSGFYGTYCQNRNDTNACNATMPCLNGGTCYTAPNGSKSCLCYASYGRRCEYVNVDCRSNPCQNGASCLAVSNTVSKCYCRSGFYGTYCQNRNDTSACNATMPCLNGGSCYTAPNGSRSCMCFNGAYGRRCENVNVDCRSNPCQNGASCLTNNGYSKCYCGFGFYGTYCQNRNDTSACNATMPCLNGGSCYTAPNGSRSCMCFNGAYGRRCEYVNVDCRSNPCQNGASCLTNNGYSKCYCGSGFYGTYCQNRNDTSACNATMPCLNGGSCYTAPNGSRSCMCFNGAYGRRCEYVNVDCRSNPCQNGASCLAVSNTVSKCYCRSGFYGTYCQNRNDTSACNATMPCLNGGSCYTAPNGSRSCMCFNGAYGRRCEYVNVDCRSNPCQNGASCITNNGYSKCYCGSGFYGTYCQNRNDTSACNPDLPCRNDGSCYDAQNGTNICLCLEGTYGRRCEKGYRTGGCFGNPCRNGGSCVQRSGDMYSCYCAHRYHGYQCQFRNTTGCNSTNPCRNGGTCIGTSCFCRNGFTGLLCEFRNNTGVCSGTYPCQNGGTCYNSKNGTNICLCRSENYGIRCENQNINCATMPCKNGGTCYAPSTGVNRCYCPVGFYGTYCENRNTTCNNTTPCRNGGTCIRTNGTNICACPWGTYGALCEYRNNTDFCDRNNCQNGGTCYNNRCYCGQGFYGTNCEFRNSTGSCRDIFCYNGGTCNRTDPTRCACPRGFVGAFCESRNNTCRNITCLNGGTCVQGLYGSVGCLCLDGFDGQRCEYRTTYQNCTIYPCKNGGTCNRRHDGNSTCLCYKGFYGSQCQFRDGATNCLKTPCQNDGHCVLMYGEYSCQCINHYTGSFCQYGKISRNCTLSPCLNGGACITDRNGNTSCECRVGHFGDRCEYRPDTSEFGPCSVPRCENGGTCGTRGAGQFMCSCAAGFSGTNCENDVSLSFPSSNITLDIEELSPLGTIVGTIFVKDLFDGTLPLTITSNDTLGLFRFDVFTKRSLRKGWHIMLQKSLDKEQISSYWLQVQVTDGTRVVNTTLVVNVKDVNDNLPRFSSSSYTATVQSDVIPFTTVLTLNATDADVGNNSEITYSILVSSAGRSRFLLERDTGILMTNDSLQNFGGQQIQLVVSAQDNGERSLTATATVTINVIQGDGKLKFNRKHLVLNVMENSRRGSAISYNAVGPVEAGRSLRVQTNDTKGIIGVNITGTANLAFVTVFVNATLDREMNSTLYFSINVTDGISTATASCVVNILDLNDNAPRFTNRRPIIRLSRLAGPSKTIARVNAFDPDAGSNGTITYDIIGGELMSDVFNISQTTGFIGLTGHVAYYPDNITFVVRAKDGGNRQDIVNVTVWIRYLDDACLSNPCRNNGECQVQASGYTCLCKPQFTGIHCEHNMPCPSNPCLNGATCILDSTLNTQCLCLSGYSGINCQNAPSFRFRQRNMNFTVPENTFGSVVGFVQVDDFIQPSVGQVSIRSNDSIVGFEEFNTSATASWRMRIQRFLDRETQSLHFILLTATLGNRSINTSLALHISDINDNAPTFNRSQYSVVLDNDVVRGSYVTTVNATDRDAGRNGTVSYSITGGSDGRSRFSINNRTGVITVTSSLLTLVGRNIQMTVTAKDGGNPSLSSSTSVFIRIQQGTAPSLRFREGNMNFTVPENRWGTILGFLQVDAINQPSVGQASVRSNDSILRFESFDTGATAAWRMIVQRRPDREQQSLHIMRLTVTLGNRSISTTLVLHISDVNDNAPAFNRSQYSVVLNNDVVRGSYVTTVNATDRDAGRNGTVSYSITGGSVERRRFAINNRTGVITVTSSLLTLVGQNIQMTVTAKDGGNPSLSSLASVFIRIQQGNGRLKFASNRTIIDVSEDTLIGTPLLELSVGPINLERPVSVSLTEPGIVEAGLTIQDNQGLVLIRLFRKLDRERRNLETIVITASDGLDETNTTLILNVTDVNDNAPRFTSADSVYINQNAKNGTNVTRVHAIDYDAGENGTVTYEILPTSALVNLFTINNRTGYLKVNGSLTGLDVNTFTLFIRAKDGGTPMMTSLMRLTVNVTSGTAPSRLAFNPRTYTATLQAPLVLGTIVSTVVLWDKDYKHNGSLASFNDPTGTVSAQSVYIFQTQNRIQVRLNTASITENRRIVTLIATVSRTGEKFNCTIILTIDRGSTNLYAPTFLSTPYSANILATQAINAVFMVVSATDRDSGVNGQIRYSMTKGNRTFGINSMTGSVYAKTQLFSLDGTKQNLTILATDGGQPPRFAATNVTVQIGQPEDPTNSPPFFSEQSYFYSITENWPNGTILGSLIATDNNGGSTVSIKLLNSRTFRLGQPITSGNRRTVPLLTNATLDRENMDNYILQAVATDGTFTATVRVTIIVQDVNDNRPVFSRNEYTIDVPLNTPRFTTIVTPQVFDADIGNNGEVTFTKQVSANPDDTGAFLVNQQTGSVVLGSSLAGSLEGRQLEFEIVATDKGTPPQMSTVSVKITVTGVAANQPPQFINLPGTVAVNENMPQATRIMMITLRDTDGPSPPFLSFQDRASYDAVDITLFTRNSSHVYYYLERKAFLDRERDSEKVIKLTASDGLDSTNRTIRIIINDVNDNAPRFSLRSYSARLSVSTGIGQPVLSVLAIDPDQESNGQVVYSIQTTQAPGVFTVDSGSGEISVSNTLAGWAGRTINLRVEARDMGTPVLNASVSVAITVTTGNVFTLPNQAPRFTAESYSLDVNENVLGKTLQLQATDSDGPQGVTFRVADGSTSDIEIIQTSVLSNTKWAVYIRTVRVFDRELSPQYEALVIADDTVTQTTATVTITVEDINDNSPVFSRSLYMQTISTTTSVGAPVLQVLATDGDAGDFGRVTYSMTTQTGPDAFRIDANNGNIILTMPLLDSGEPVYRLLVTATDLGRKSSTATVVINIDFPQ